MMLVKLVYQKTHEPEDQHSCKEANRCKPSGLALFVSGFESLHGLAQYLNE